MKTLFVILLSFASLAAFANDCQEQSLSIQSYQEEISHLEGQSAAASEHINLAAAEGNEDAQVHYQGMKDDYLRKIKKKTDRLEFARETYMNGCLE